MRAASHPRQALADIARLDWHGKRLDALLASAGLEIFGGTSFFWRQERRGLTRDHHVGSAGFFLRTSAKTRTAALRPARETNEPGGSSKQLKLRQSYISRRCRSVPIGLLGVLHG
jgi:hypothetical protein